MDRTHPAAASGDPGVHPPQTPTPAPSHASDGPSGPDAESAARRRRRRGRRGGRGRSRKGEVTAENVAAPNESVAVAQPAVNEARPAKPKPAPRPADAQRQQRPQQANGGAARNRSFQRAGERKRQDDRGRPGERNGAKDRRRRGRPDTETVRRPGDPVPSSAIWAGWSAARFGGGSGD